AVVWTRAPRPGPLRLILGRTDARGRVLVASLHGIDVTVRGGADGTISVPVRRLLPRTRYAYSFAQSSLHSGWGFFRTSPKPDATATIRFAFSGDADATPGPNGKLGFNQFQVYGRMAAERNDFNINLGDTIYSDSELAGSQPALTVAAKWQKYKLGLGLP